MIQRISNQELKVRVDYINHLFNRSPKLTELGHIFIDNYSPGENPYQYKLGEMMESGGQHDWTNYRMTRKEFYAYLNGIIQGIEEILHPDNLRTNCHR